MLYLEALRLLMKVPRRNWEAVTVLFYDFYLWKIKLNRPTICTIRNIYWSYSYFLLLTIFRIFSITVKLYVNGHTEINMHYFAVFVQLRCEECLSHFFRRLKPVWNLVWSQINNHTDSTYKFVEVCMQWIFSNAATGGEGRGIRDLPMCVLWGQQNSKRPKDHTAHLRNSFNQ